jgi:uncharacterized YigZ family protein
MYFTDKHYVDTLEVKQSKFIAHLIPYDLYEEQLQVLKSKHPKARHFVVAFRYLNEYNQVVEYSTDDGEPKGTSGKPSLMVLQGKEIINSAVIVVRYFGGTKLGTGGLVRAYSDAVNLVIDMANLIEYKKESSLKIEIKYEDVRFIEYECENIGVRIIDKEFSSNVIYKIKADEDSMDKFMKKVKRVVKEVK